MALGKRLEEALGQIGKDQAWLAKETGIDARTISATITRDSKRSEYTAHFANALGLNPIWLLTGEGPQWDVNPAQRFGAPGAFAAEATRPYDGFKRPRNEVPLISYVQAGRWREVADPYTQGDAEAFIPCPVPHGPRTYALRVRGESMYNPEGPVSFSDGDIIFVDPDKEAATGALVIARLEDQMETTFKQLVREGDHIWLKALNPGWPERYIRVDQRATTCGVVISKAVSYQ
jgi:SOS-response transcriptional repressor LexA